MEYMYYNQTGNISTLDGTSLKLVDKLNLPRKQRFINRKGHRHEVNESMDSYQQAIDYMEIRPNW